ncbi:MAG: acetylglutamate kinase [Candidatus Methanoperedenaceae archaeon]|nr:MAG: acetylglutamate kinase [Candidatus Methanoperedenaceae archaeon]
MMLKREDILIEALPYIREFHDSIILIKMGGHAIVDPEIMEKIVQDIVLLKFVGIHPVIVHGGGPEITEKMERMGKKPEFVAGLRITDDETLEIARMVLVGNVNSKIVSLISRHGGKGIGISGSDGRLIVAKKLALQHVTVGGVEKDIDLGWVGETEVINPEIVMILAGKGYIPVISPIATDEKGNDLNVNADTVAGDIAVAIGAKKLISLTDVPGILRDPKDPKTRISRIAFNEIETFIADNIISGGMIPKIKSSASALKGGVRQVHIIDGGSPHSLLIELFTNEGVGTMIFRKE